MQTAFYLGGSAALALFIVFYTLAARAVPV